MSAPIFFFSSMICDNFCKTKCNVKFNESRFWKIQIGLIIADAVVSISALVIGILGVVSVIGMPAAAAYTLIGVSGLITLPWLAVAILYAGISIKECCEARATKSKLSTKTY